MAHTFTFVTFVTLHSLDSDRKLARLSPFIIKKIIDYNVNGEVKDVKRFANGDLRVETFLDSSQITIETQNVPRNSNRDFDICIRELVQGCAVPFCFHSDPNEEILDGLAKYLVVDINHFIKAVSGERVKIGALVVTFGVPVLPVEVKH